MLVWMLWRPSNYSKSRWEMTWWQSCGWRNTLQKQLEVPLHKEWPCCESRFHLVAVTHIHFSSVSPTPELMWDTNPGPMCRWGRAGARSTLSPAASTANTEGSPGKEGEWDSSSSSPWSGSVLCTHVQQPGVLTADTPSKTKVSL